MVCLTPCMHKFETCGSSRKSLAIQTETLSWPLDLHEAPAECAMRTKSTGLRPWTLRHQGARRPHDHLLLVTATEAVKGVLNDGSSAQEDASAFSFCCNLLGLQYHGTKQKGRIFHRNLVVITPGLTQADLPCSVEIAQMDLTRPIALMKYVFRRRPRVGDSPGSRNASARAGQKVHAL